MKKTLTIVSVVVLVAGIALILGRPYFTQHHAVALSEAPTIGTAFTAEADLSESSDKPNAFAKLQDIIKKRFLALGTSVYIESSSEKQLRIVVPFTNDVQKVIAVALITQRGVVEFRSVNVHSDDILLNGEPMPTGYEILKKVEVEDGQQRIQKYVVKTEAEPGLSGQIVEHAEAIIDPIGMTSINFVLKQTNAIALAKVTRDNIGHQLAIVIDGHLFLAPRIESPLETGEATLTGSNSKEGDMAMAAILDNPLPTPVKIVTAQNWRQP